MNESDRKLLRGIRRERTLAGPRVRSNKFAPKKGKGSYKRTTKYGRYE